MNENQGFLLSLLIWYQSQGRKPNSFQFPHVINFEKPSCDRVSFRSPFPSPKAFRSVESSSENIHRRGLFRRRLFPTPPTPQRAPGGDLQFFPKHRNQKTTHAPATRVFPAGNCISCAGAWATFRQRASSSSLAWCWLATLHTCFCHSSPARASFGVLLPPLALRTAFPGSSGYFFSTSIPARALGSVLLPFRWCHGCFSFLFGLSHGWFFGFSFFNRIWSRIRALFDPNILYSPDKWIWLLKLPFFPLSYLDLLWLLRRNWLAVKIIFLGLPLLNFGLWDRDMRITWLHRRQISLRLSAYSGER